VELFLQQHKRDVIGVLEGLDRVMFKGTLRSICHDAGMDRFLGANHILYRDFARFARGLSDQLGQQAEAMAQESGRPYLYLNSSALRKDHLVRQMLQEDQIAEGLICVLGCVEPCRSFAVVGRGRLSVKLMERKCLHYYYYFMDRELGLMHVRIQSWLPFTIQVCINGREYLRRRLDAAGIGYVKQENCFTRIDDLAAAQRMLAELEERKWVRLLNAFARKVNPLLKRKGWLDLQGYYWSAQESEYATDVMFSNASSLKAIYPKLVEHAMRQFSCQDVLRFLGRRVNSRFNGEACSDIQLRPEGIRIKHRVEENSIKMYDKQGCVLRVETTINNPRRFKLRGKVKVRSRLKMGWRRMRKGVCDLRQRLKLCRQANHRYLEALAALSMHQEAGTLLDRVSYSRVQQGRAYRGLRPVSAEECRMFQILLDGSYLLAGFTAAQVRGRLYPQAATDARQHKARSGRMSRFLRLLRVHGLIHKLPHTHRYRLSHSGQKVMSAALRIRAADIQNLAA
jgi:hypothetical protein